MGNDKYANKYDMIVQKHEWVAPDVLFGATYEFVKPGETLLDLGIGTGLSSVLFQKAGLKVSGMDISTEILEICEAKSIASELTTHDFSNLPFPYENSSFDCIVSTGVFSLFEDISSFFVESGRIIREGGIFAFVAEDRKEGESGIYLLKRNDPTSTPKTHYRHSRTRIHELLHDNGFVPRKIFRFESLKGLVLENGEESLFSTVYVAQKGAGHSHGKGRHDGPSGNRRHGTECH